MPGYTQPPKTSQDNNINITTKHSQPRHRAEYRDVGKQSSGYFNRTLIIIYQHETGLFVLFHQRKKSTEIFFDKVMMASTGAQEQDPVRVRYQRQAADKTSIRQQVRLYAGEKIWVMPKTHRPVLGAQAGELPARVLAKRKFSICSIESSVFF